MNANAHLLCDIALVSQMSFNWQLENLSDVICDRATHDPDGLIAMFVQFVDANGLPPELVSEFRNCIRESAATIDRDLYEHKMRNLLRKIAAQLTARHEFSGPDKEIRVSRIVAGVTELENLRRQFTGRK